MEIKNKTKLFDNVGFLSWLAIIIMGFDLYVTDEEEASCMLLMRLSMALN